MQARTSENALQRDLRTRIQSVATNAALAATAASDGERSSEMLWNDLTQASGELAETVHADLLRPDSLNAPVTAESELRIDVKDVAIDTSAGRTLFSGQMVFSGPACRASSPVELDFCAWLDPAGSRSPGSRAISAVLDPDSPSQASLTDSKRPDGKSRRPRSFDQDYLYRPLDNTWATIRKTIHTACWSCVLHSLSPQEGFPKPLPLDERRALNETSAVKEHPRWGYEPSPLGDADYHNLPDTIMSNWMAGTTRAHLILKVVQQFHKSLIDQEKPFPDGAFVVGRPGEWESKKQQCRSSLESVEYLTCPCELRVFTADGSVFEGQGQDNRRKFTLKIEAAELPSLLKPLPRIGSRPKRTTSLD